VSTQQDNDLKELEKDLRANRKSITPHQAAETCVPGTFFQMGTPQFGAPLALNNNAAVSAFKRSTNNKETAVPIIHRDNTTTNVKRRVKSALGKDFKSSKHCWKCGFQRKLHFPFGDNCNNNSGNEECSKCGWRMSDHHQDGMHGPFCDREATKEDCANWCKQKLSETAQGALVLCWMQAIPARH